MLKFLLPDNVETDRGFVLRNAYLLDSELSAVRAEMFIDQRQLLCRKREAGAAAFASLHDAGDCGLLTLQTCLLPEREQPYLLALELARHRLMLMYNKMEEWGMLDLQADHSVTRRFERARKLFTEALCIAAEQPQQASRLAQDALVCAIDGSEELALAHAEILLQRRRTLGSLPRYPLGCGVDINLRHDRIRNGLAGNFDFVSLPLPWRKLCATASEYAWDQIDDWVEWAGRSRIPLIGGPLISFEPNMLPDWVYIWQHDFEHMRDLVYEHIERVVQRYKTVIQSWVVLSGLHVNDHMPFGFDHVIDLTRTAAMLVKRLAPQARVSVEITQPFGEYFARNPRSIPPIMYVEQIIQHNMPVDAIGLKVAAGHAVSGQYARDLMQLSHLMDQFAGFGKPLHLTMAAPSESLTPLMIQSPDGQTPADAQGGYWRRPWSPQVQGRWLEALSIMAMSKPGIEAVCWQDFIDHPESEVPLSGLVSEDMQPKLSFRRMVAFRSRLLGKPAATAPETSGRSEVLSEVTAQDGNAAACTTGTETAEPLVGNPPVDPDLTGQVRPPEPHAPGRHDDASDPPVRMPPPDHHHNPKKRNRP